MKLQEYESRHLEELRPHLAECTVLLKRGSGFPLYGPGKLALYGSGARHTVKGGTGSGEVNSHTFVTVEQGLRNAGFEITTEKWLDGYDEVLRQAQARFIDQLRAEAKKQHTNAFMMSMGAVMPEPEYYLPLDGEGDTAVYVLSRNSGEGSDRSITGGDLLLSGPEVRDILALTRKYEKFLLVLNVGGAVDLSPVLPYVENILLLSQLGVETGACLADLLLGRAYPSGKLATTWAAVEDYPAIGDFGSQDDTHYREGVYVGYRYYDSVEASPLFPFGFGLGYTDFALSDPETRVEGERVSVKVDVSNTGAASGKETVQLYVSKPEGELDQPYQCLAAFAKTGDLAPSASEGLEISFDMSELASYDMKKSAWVLEAGDYILRLGVSSRDTSVCAVLRLEDTVTVIQARPCCGKPNFTDWHPENRRTVEVPEGTPVYTVIPGAIPLSAVRYGEEPAVDERVKALTNEELIYMNIGSFDPKAGAQSVIGASSFAVAGAAGETAGLFKDRDIPALVMADGPAGLRLSKDYVLDEKGPHSLGLPFPSSMEELMTPVQRRAVALAARKPKRGEEVLHQYATAIPIGTAIAQTWNPAFASLCGDIVGREMERFGIHLWLAPALNIHRDTRCGRDFEYYSEDPLISGCFAAAITQGVQQHPGCGVTIKHFAANNQETNRFQSNSQVSERALREIYLRGFGLCVRQAQPHALMTSYNLINGVHSSERRDLVEDILRAEFGFEGIVMTDWVIHGWLNKKAVYPVAQPWKVAAAGGDIFMPGCKEDYKNIASALKSGKLSREQLEINASRICRMADRLNKV